ncbi:MAG: arylsulfatase [Pirellulaceae bacterium]
MRTPELKTRYCLLLLSLLVIVQGRLVADERLPNIVILYADDMGHGDLEVQNPQSKIPTPNLNQLAAQGTRFTDAHSSSGICTPSRYALLQGRYHWRKFHGIVNAFDQPVLDEERTTIAELLKARGYRTACIGKWHLGWDWDAIKRPGATLVVHESASKPQYLPSAFDWQQAIPGGPLSHGFDYYFGDDVPNFPPYAWFENDRVITEPTVPLTSPKPTAEGNWEARPGPAVADWDFWEVMPKLTDRAVEWIGEQKADQPFFLYFPFTSPHAPIVPAKEFIGKSQAGGYGDFVVQTDDTVGRVLAALRAAGVEDNTLVIFSSDNGPERYAYDRVRNFKHRSMGTLRGLKRDLWEGGHRVPMIVKWPNRVPAGRISDELISQIDLYATLARVVGVDVPQDNAEDSCDQLGLLLGSSPTARDTLVHNTNANGYALRHGSWSLIAAKTGAISKVPAWFDEAFGFTQHSQPGELYDLSQDIGQRKNLYAEQSEKVRELEQMLNTLQSAGQVRR